MNNTKAIIILLCSLWLGICFGADKQTFMYASKAEQDLYLDFYAVESEQPAPCLIYLFGGGFIMGQRDDERFQDYFNYLNDNGYAVISIDYRLGLKGIRKDDVPITKMPDILMETVYKAVEDLYDATLFTLEHSEEWNIDPKKLIINGSSAGAITILQAEYELCRRSEIANRLPEGFNYAAAISYAGAVVQIGPEMKWKGDPCPIMLFHGNADDYVTFNRTGILCANMYGSQYIADQLKRINAPFYFYIEENMDHAMASLPLRAHRRRVLDFLDEFVHQGRRLQIIYNHEDLSVPEKKKDLVLFDYLKTLTRHIEN